MTVPSNRVSLFVSGLLFCGFSVAGCSSTERQSGTAGAPGIGDTLFPTRGNGGYDVATYDISLEWQPRPDVIVATETITASATQALSAFNLDLHGLTVTSVTVNRRDATFSRDGDELTITPARALANASKFTTVIAYNGTPEPQDGEGWYHDGNGGVVVFGQPGGASVWHPVNDHPLDKAGYSVHITAPSNMNAAANGTLTETVDNGATKTWTFEQPFPAAPYLQMLAIGDYTIVEGGASKSTAARCRGISRRWRARGPQRWPFPI